MKKLKIFLIIISFLLILLALYTGCDLYNVSSPGGSGGKSNSSSTWTKLLGAYGAYTSARDIILDPNGNIYITGETDGFLDNQALKGDTDLFIVKYNSTGVKQWTKLLGVSGAYTIANGITLDTNINIYITGYTNGDLDGQFLTGVQDLFVVKYNSTGVKQWTKLLGASNANTYACDIILDLDGNVYTTGSTYGNLDGQFLTGVQDLFVVKYDANANKQWTKLLGVSGAYTTANGIILDTNINIYITGSTTGNLYGKTLTGNRDLFVAKYNSSGDIQWTKLLGVSNAYTGANDIILATNGNIYVVGSTNGNLYGETLTGDQDLFIVKYNPDGDILWTKLLGVSGAKTSALAITSDLSGNLYITGCTEGNLDGEILTGNRDLFVVKYNSIGEKQWTKLLGVYRKYTRAYSITSDTNGNVYTTGYTSGNLDGQTLAGVEDAFIVKYNANGVKQ